MKKTICLILALCLLLSLTACASGSDDLMANITPNTAPKEYTSGDQGNAVTDFGLRLFRESYSAGENTLISPLSVLTALAMTANGAKGKTLAQMEEVLGLDVQTLNNWIHAYMAALPDSADAKLSLANSIWFKDTDSFAVNPDFLQRNADFYGADIYKAAFDSATKDDINRWVEENTDGMIKDILDEIPEEAVMYLVNALTFDAQWQEIYKDSAIREGEFTTENGTRVMVDMMYSTESKYLEDDLATGFIKYYEGGEYAFAALLPAWGVTVEEYLESLTGDGLQQLLANLETVTVHAAMPKFELEYDVEMSEILRAMGMTDAFSADLADFSGIGTSAEGNLFINRVLHKTYICVDGKGTRAGAATAVEINCETAAIEEDFKTVTLDRPFVYMLIDTRTNLPFFIGTMMDPSGEFTQVEEPVLENPPELTLRSGYDEFTLQSGNCSWFSPGKNGESSAFIACGTHPMGGFRDHTFRVVTEDILQLSFPVAPDTIAVRRWPMEQLGNVDARAENVTLKGLTLSVEEGSWIYEITATWDRGEWGGEASYHLYISR